MKYKFLIITSYNKRTGLGNFTRCIRFFKYLKKNNECKMLVNTSSTQALYLRKFFKNFKILNLKDIKIKKEEIIFLDTPNLDKKTYEILNKGKLICYGNNNYFKHKKKIVPYDSSILKNSSIFYSITDNNFKKIKYEKLKKLFFFIYLSTNFKNSFLKKLIDKIRENFSNKIYLYTNKKNLNFLSKKKNLRILNNFRPNYISNNMIYIGNVGSGSIDRFNRGVVSFTFSKNSNEKKIYKSIKNYHKNLFYFGSEKNFNYVNFLVKIKNLKKLKYPFMENKKSPFLNNNLKLKKKVVSLFNS